MKVAFIYPPISRLERYSSEIGSAGGSQIPLGIYYLAASLRECGHSVCAIDGEANNLTAEIIVDDLKKFAPDVIGISSTTVAFHRTIELAQLLKKDFPETPLVLGGPHVTSNPQHAMSVEVFDVGVLREGEQTMLDVISSIKEKNNLRQVPGLVLREGDELVFTQAREMIQDLDQLPFPAIDLVPDISLYNPPPSNYKKLPVANVITSRGCPSLCTFCDNAVFGTQFRKRSASNVADEIEMLYREFGVREIAFVDDTFTIDKKRIYDLFEDLSRRQISVPWTCMSRINTVDRELLEFMRDHGCWHISFGIESGEEKILKHIKKFISLEKATQVINWCSELGVRTKGFFIVGHPGETEASIDKTIEFALDLALDDVVVTINTPIPGSPQYREVDQYGQLDETDWSQFNYWRPVFVPHGLTPDILINRQKEFYRRFYFRPRILWRYFLSFLSPSGPRRFWALLKSLPFVLKR